MGTEPLVIRTDDGRRCTLTLDRPEKHNALSVDLFVELRALIDAVAADPDVGVVVLRGAGRSFCAGNDLGGIASGAAAPSPMFQPETVDALEAVPVPTIAAIHGHCYTGGLELALGCDLLVAAEDASIGDTHGQWGLVPIWGMSVRLPERVGRSKAKELSFTARRVSGAEAERIGLVDRAVPAADLDAAVDELCDEILANSPGTNRIMKRLIDEHGRMDRTDALLRERSRPHGMPDDAAERLAAGGR